MKEIYNAKDIESGDDLILKQKSTGKEVDLHITKRVGERIFGTTYKNGRTIYIDGNINEYFFKDTVKIFRK